MHLPSTTLLLTLATLATPALTTPLPGQSLAEIERRWSAGETEASIHSGRTHRDATPAWPVQREADAEAVAATFSYATDERTMLSAQRQKRAEATPLLKKMKDFVDEFYRSRGEKGAIARDAQVVRVEEDIAPVLKPRRGMKYAFTA